MQLESGDIADSGALKGQLLHASPLEVVDKSGFRVFPVGRKKRLSAGVRREGSGRQPATMPRPSLMEQMNMAYEAVVKAIIRPPRTEYETSHLGPQCFEFLGKRFERYDFEVRNSETYERLACSRWARVEVPAKMQPTLIFLHGNASARVEALAQLSVCLSLGVSVVAFDFSGSGMSDGDYVTLGVREKGDVRAVVQYLRDECKTSTIALWGRSMGAVAALLYADEDNMVDAMVLDSPFASLRMLAEELVARATANSRYKVPSFAVTAILRLVRSSILKRAKVDINDIAAIDHVSHMYVPALFCAVRGDSFISNAHSERLHAKYAGEKFYLLVEGDHNDVRPPSMLVFVRRFLQRYMQVPNAWTLDALKDSVFSSVVPWHAAHGRPLEFTDAPLPDATCMPNIGNDDNDFNFSDALDYQDVDVGMNRAKVDKVQSDIANLLDVASMGATRKSPRIQSPALPNPQQPIESDGDDSRAVFTASSAPPSSHSA